ncbi:hypothetical protein LOTGIDRAFT_152003 [Lottia gigantea]|uniref:Uncharacterized protein n=1 Tax=Lottia gigantea TaxID=225164 RepID=V4B419_LOTGI|nr:hypothetical protein LOTGIDRAFT_152003 [Lottia gigantea]ESP05193.1 hypothetical protein LOTGIDRAFT_152003 [Lottia gigantea]
MADHNESQLNSTPYFDPEKHPKDTLKAFTQFVICFELRYDAQYPDPPKVSLDAALERWKIQNTTAEDRDPKPNILQYDTVRNAWRSRDRVAKLLGMFTSNRFYADWLITEPDEQIRKDIDWDDFLTKMRRFYKGSDNETVQNFHFRDISQEPDETFPGFCNKVKREAKHCAFKCDSPTFTAESTAIRDQIIIGTSNNNIREEALLRDWNLTYLCQKGMAMESAARGGIEIADTGACVSVCGTSQAKRWNLLDKLVSSKVRIKPYMSNPISVHGTAICSVTFGSISVPVEWQVISGFCEPILSGDKALQLGIINFSPKAEIFFPIHSIDKTTDDVSKISLQKILTHYPENFTGLGKLRHHQVKLHFDVNVKPVNVPPRPVAYHLKECVHCAIDEMIKQDVIEEHPSNQPAPWISCAVITPKPSGEI